MRGLGLTLAEIRDLAGADGPAGPRLALQLRAARERTDQRIADLQRMRRRIVEFEAKHRAELAGQASPWTDNPRACPPKA